MGANRRKAGQVMPNRNATGGGVRGRAFSVPEGGVGASVSQVGSATWTAETPAADRVSGPLPRCPPKMEFLLGNPFSTPVGQCLGKAARRAGVWVGDGGAGEDCGPLWGTGATSRAGHPCRRACAYGQAGPAHDASDILPGGARRPNLDLKMLHASLPIRAQPFLTP